jgi:hypothetical protein
MPVGAALGLAVAGSLPAPALLGSATASDGEGDLGSPGLASAALALASAAALAALASRSRLPGGSC